MMMVFNQWDGRGPCHTVRIDTVARFHGKQQIGLSVRTAGRSLALGALDITHFDSVRFPPPDLAGPR